MIIEDDVIVSINSLGFIEKYKEELEKDKDIFFISLNSPCDKFITILTIQFFHIWGWYVSKKNWEEYRNYKKRHVPRNIFKTFKFEPTALLYWFFIYFYRSTIFSKVGIMI